MVTIFGKFLRKLRIERDMVLKDMAKILDVSSAYLSSIELGKRAIPSSFLNKLISEFKISPSEAIDVEKMIASSQPLKIKVDNVDERSKETILAFARNFNNLNDEDKDLIQKIMEKNNGK